MPKPTPTMNILVVEDEVLAANRLCKMIKQCAADAHILFVADGVESALKWLSEGGNPNLAFFDIQLGDGLSFEIFEKTNISFPVIFTTAYDEFALKAFKVHSIDYLLKPILKEELDAAIQKFRKFHSGNAVSNESIKEVIELIRPSRKSRFLVKVGEHLRSIAIADVHYFYSSNKFTFLNTDDNKHYDLSHSLDEIEQMLEPGSFFRVNRQFLLSLKSISDIVMYSQSRLLIRLHHPSEEEVIVSREKVSLFKDWLNQ